MNAETKTRKYDVIIWGATGFTGRLVVEYFRDTYPLGGDVAWAVAARSRDKLDSILGEIGMADAKPDVLIADSTDDDSLTQLAQQTRVVLTTVGPYAKYGSGLVRACVEAGTHYCDLAGEVQWMRKMIDSHQAEAQASGARIVHSCGFDSIPSDIGVWFLQREAVEKTGGPCTHIDLLVKAMKGGPSGGTIASMLTAVEQARADREIRRIMADPYALNPEGERSGPDRRDQTSAEYNEVAEVWTAPFVMASINTRIVRRSNALSDYAYGENFTYHEAVITGTGAGGRLKATGSVAGLGAFMLASSFDFSREKIVRRMVPKPGEGPTREQRENGFFNLRLYGQTADGNVLQARVTGDRDPGYGSTSKMLGEAAVCLAKDDLAVAGGFWTPASAMGEHLLQRLQENAGLTFTIE